MFGNKRRRIPVSKDDIKKAIKNANDKLKAENKKIEASIEKAKDALKTVETETKDALKKADQAESTLSSYNSSIGNNLKSLDKTRRDLQASQKRLTESEADEQYSKTSLEEIAKKELSLSKAVKSLEVKLKERDGLAKKIKDAKAEYKELDSELSIVCRRVDVAKTDIVSLKSSKDVLQSEFDSFKSDILGEKATLAAECTKIKHALVEKIAESKAKIGAFDKSIAERMEESETYEALVSRGENAYATLQAKIMAAEKRLNGLKGEADAVVANKQKQIDGIKSRYEGWKLNELDRMAKLKLKGKIDNIDKAGLAEILGG